MGYKFDRLYDRWYEWSPSQDTRDVLEFLGWIGCGFLGAITLTLPIWFYLLRFD